MHMPMSQVLITALVGFLIVFAVLVILMIVIKIMAFVFSKTSKKAKNAPANATAPTESADKIEAPGSCGGLVLKNVSDKDAAMIMAIVADELKTPLCELRFKSIKLLEENDK